MSGRNLAASIRDRLLNKARAEKPDYNLLLTRYALERMIYRMSISAERDRFLLKGALLFDLWFDVPHRPTHDADFLGFGSAEMPQVEAVFRDICRIDVDDGIVFDPDSVKAAEIRKEANYAGIRVTLLGRLDTARCPVQADIGFGDAVIPGPAEVDYPGTNLAGGRSHRQKGTRHRDRAGVRGRHREALPAKIPRGAGHAGIDGTDIRSGCLRPGG